MRRREFQGLWRSEMHTELSLATTQRGEVVGVYRQIDRGEVREYGLSGLILGDQLVFSVPFPDYGVIGSWAGRLVRDAGGLRYEALRWTFGDEATGSDDFGETAGGRTECFRRVSRRSDPSTVRPIGSARTPNGRNPEPTLPS